MRVWLTHTVRRREDKPDLAVYWQVQVTPLGIVDETGQPVAWEENKPLPHLGAKPHVRVMAPTWFEDENVDAAVKKYLYLVYFDDTGGEEVTYAARCFAARFDLPLRRAFDRLGRVYWWRYDLRRSEIVGEG